MDVTKVFKSIFKTENIDSLATITEEILQKKLSKKE